MPIESEDGKRLRKLLDRAAHLREVGRYGDAIKHYQDALSESPDNAFILDMLADTFSEGGDYDTAEEYAQLSIAADPNFAGPYSSLAAIYLKRRNPHRAYEYAKIAAGLEAGHPGYLNQLGVCALARGRVEEAHLLAQRVVDLIPDEPRGHLLFGMVALARDDNATAAAFLAKALELNPEDAYTAELLADAQRHLEQDDPTADLYQAALENDPHDVGTRLALKESLNRLALFGEPGQRLGSLAGMLSALTAFYLLVWGALTSFAGDGTAWINRIAFLVLPVITVALIVLARSQFISERFPNLAVGYDFEKEQQRKGWWTGVIVIAACVFGMALIMYRAGLDAVIAFAPIWLPLAGLWIGIVLIPITLIRYIIVDRAIFGSANLVERVQAAERTRRKVFTATGAIFYFFAALFNQPVLLLFGLAFLLGVAMETFAKFPYRVIAALVALGFLTRALSDRLPSIIDLEPNILAFILLLLAGGMTLVALRTTIGNRIERRRIEKLFAKQAPPQNRNDDDR
ncbi:MAG: tetratricopeptide repeat protein [Pseudomonadota bacterium]